MTRQVLLLFFVVLAAIANWVAPRVAQRMLPRPPELLLTMVASGQLLTAFALLVAVYLLWRGKSVRLRVVALLLAVSALIGIWPGERASVDLRFVTPQEASQVPDHEPVLALTLGSTAKAYPLRYLAQSRILEDETGGVAVLVAATGHCHAAEVWSREVDGVKLQFEIGLRDGVQYLLRDRQSGSWWDPHEGLAIAGEKKGTQLRHIPAEELSLGAWDDEHPKGLVWHAAGIAAALERATEVQYLLVHEGIAYTYRFQDLGPSGVLQKPRPVVLLRPREGEGLRAFAAEHPETGEALEFVAVEELGEGRMVDHVTSSHWNFRGCGVRGELEGGCLARVPLRRFCSEAARAD